MKDKQYKCYCKVTKVYLGSEWRHLVIGGTKPMWYHKYSSKFKATHGYGIGRGRIKNLMNDWAGNPHPIIRKVIK